MATAIAFHVPGPTIVRVKVDPLDASYVDIGHTPDDDLVSLEYEVFNTPLLSSRTGDVPGDFIYRGKVGSLALTFVEWDQQVLRDLMVNTTPFSAALLGQEGSVGQIGRGYLPSAGNSSLDFSFSVEIHSLLDPGTQGSNTLPDGHVYNVEIKRCLLLGPTSHRSFNWGNADQMEALAITVLPDVAGNLYTKTAVNVTP